MSIDLGRFQLGDDVTAVCKSPSALYGWSLQRMVDSRFSPLPEDDTEGDRFEDVWNKTAYVGSLKCDQFDSDCLDVPLTESPNKFESIIICTLFAMTVALVALCTASVYGLAKRRFLNTLAAEDSGLRSAKSDVQLTRISISKETVDGKEPLNSGDEVVRKLAEKLREDIVNDVGKLLERTLASNYCQFQNTN
jgi:hypothetical protein